MAGEGAGKPPACTWGVSFPCGMTKRGPAIPPLLSLYLDPPAGSVLRRNEGENQMTKPLAELLTQIDGGGPIDVEQSANTWRAMTNSSTLLAP